ncbi:L,D-transpeptidase family protein [Mediterraneibacter faecis]|uniref:L,D-transpeptidase family protein n=1 Tax=Mediterraneibacter faecis TaxID=592978 RepID=UPI0022E56938|nr:L,D-transpeptidase family protein [Mediterraneibacter faecis]
MSEKKVVRRRKVRRKKKQKTIDKKIWMIIGGVIAGLVIVYLAISVFFMSHFYINTQINGKNFSGKNAAAVENYIKNQVADYKLTIVEQNNMTDAIEGSDISLVYKENSDIEDALKKQNAFLWPQAFFLKSSAEVTIEVGYDEAALESKIEAVQALNQEQTDPQSAYPKYDGNSFVVEPEVYGTKVDVDTFTAKVKDAITNFKSELNMMDEKCYAMPKYTSESPEVQKACDAMNNYLKASITYKMTNQDVVVNKDLISGWVTYDEDMNATLDESKVKEWLREFGKTYDTVGTTRSITTPGGKTVDVSGGTYGWSVDEAAELTALVDSIKKGEVAEKEPAYAQTAATHDAQDWGTTYLEVDIPAQHMWYVVNGAVQLETDVVTGLPTPERETPTGVYSILEMKRDKVLTGTINPSTGKPIYQTQVAYWMRVTWTGIGFHDAIWQSAFGGNRYQTSAGSHGCINMPLDQAASLYGMLSMGTPVIIHN